MSKRCINSPSCRSIQEGHFCYDCGFLYDEADAKDHATPCQYATYGYIGHCIDCGTILFDQLSDAETFVERRDQKSNPEYYQLCSHCGDEFPYERKFFGFQKTIPRHECLSISSFIMV